MCGSICERYSVLNWNLESKFFVAAVVFSEMFEWNDEEELANIIWSEAGENDDHIVPYPDGTEGRPPGTCRDHNKKWDQEAGNFKLAEQKILVAATDPVGEIGSSCQHDTYGGVPAAQLGSWPDLSLSNAATTDHDQMDERVQLDKGSEIFENQPVDREDCEFVYNWANMGSFDDLDRILSKDDPIFGHVSLGNADEMWSSSKDAASSPEKSVSLSLDLSSFGLEASSKLGHSETKAEHMIDEDKASPGFQKLNGYTFHSKEDANALVDNLEYGEGNTEPIMKNKAASEVARTTSALNYTIDAVNARSSNEIAVDKVSKQIKLLQSTGGKSEARKLEMFSGPWSSFGDRFKQFDGKYAPQMGQPSPSPVQSQQLQFQGLMSSRYKMQMNPILSPVYTSVRNLNQAMPALPLFNRGNGNHKQLPSGSEVSSGKSNPLNKWLDASMKTLNMTPQEKIEN